MKLTKRALTFLLVGAMTLPCVACKRDSGNEDQGSVDNPSVSDTTAADANGNSDGDGGTQKAPSEAEDKIVQDETGLVGIELSLGALPQGAVVTTEPPVVTTTVGTDGKVYVNQTDINGTTVTEAGGSQATVLYTGTTLATSYAEPSYTAKPLSYQALWLDMSKRADFVFDGEFLVFDIEIKPNTPDGVYPLEFFHLDMANYDAKSLDVTANVGYIVVGDAKAPEVETVKGEGLTLTPAVVSGKAGEKVKMIVNMENNPGFVGFDLQFNYDSNAMDIVGGSAGKDFETFASMTAHSFE